MNGDEVSHICRTHYHTNPFFLTVCSADTLPDRIPDDGFFIISNTDYSEENGSHWVLIFAQPFSLDRKVLWFDSLGKVPQDYHPEFTLYLSKINKSYFINTYQCQPISSQHCAHFCLFVADMLCMGCDFHSALSTFHPTKLWVNDGLAVRHVYRHMTGELGSASRIDCA